MMKKWFALYVRMHHEKKIAERFKAQGVECFLPIQEVVRQWSDRKKKIQQVVIPMMIFVHVTEKERLPLLQDPSAVSYLTLRGTRHPAVIPDKEMERFIFMFDYSDEAIYFTGENLEPGCRIQVIKGPLTGLEGELCERQGKCEVLVRINQLGCALVEIPVGYLKRLD